MSKRETSSNADVLFASESDSDEIVRKEDKAAAKRKKPSSASSSGSSHSSAGPSGVKKSKPTVHPITPVEKITAHDLFGTDSEDEGKEDEKPATSIHTAYNTPTMIRSDELNVSKCNECQIDLPKSQYQYHVRTNLHKSNCLLRTEFNNIDIIATAFKNRIMTYRLIPMLEDEYLMPEAFLHANTDNINRLINISLSKNDCIKANFELYAKFMLPKNEEQQLKSFNTKCEVILRNTDLSEFYLNAVNTMMNKLSEFQHCESGWTFLSISHLEINVNKYSPLKGGSYIELPQIIKNTKSCLNVQNKDNHCLLWSIVAGLFPCKVNVCRTNSYPHYSTVLNIKDMSFPSTVNDIKIFEKNNPNISLNIYGLDNKNNITGPLYRTNVRKDNHINLLFIEKNGKQHYCLIKNLLRLVRGQVSHHKGTMYLCEDCLQFFSSKLKYDSHNCSKVLTELPPKHSSLRFKHYERRQKINFIIYSDFESVLINHQENSSGNTTRTKLHKPSCFAFYICCSHDSTLNKFVTYRGSDCIEKFIQYLIKEIENIYEILRVKKPMLPLTNEELNQYQNAKVCHICNELLFDDKVADHDHVTGLFRAASHAHCNLSFQVCSFIPVVFHNLCGYDIHLFIKELAKYKGEIKIIPKTKEKYITVTKYLPTQNSNFSMQIKFIDSFQFLNSSLDTLSKTLNADDFVHLSSQFENKDHIQLIHQKGIYPYDYIDSLSRYEERSLPPKKCFYNSMTQEHISDEEYIQAQNVWKSFDIQCLGEYTDLYLKCDVLLLCDIFETFRNTCLHHYKLDPAYYVSSPGLSWDAMLLYTKVQLDLIDDLEMYELLERGIRGGLAQCSRRHAKANNKYLPDFDDQKNSSFLIYLDCNNLYGYAMMKKLPISDFRFLTEEEIKKFNIFDMNDEDNFGYILEVDLTYPDHLHNSHSDLPFAPEKFTPPGAKTQKLIANLYDKFKYVIHYVHLKECLKQGLTLSRIHRILRFHQDNYLKKYIDLNTQLRQQSTSTFHKDFFKLLNNSIFGKTIENKRKQVTVKLVNQWVDTKNVTNKNLGAEKLITKPNFKNVSVFSENFVAIQLNPEKIILDRPIYIGFSVLEYAKTHLYQFHYNFMQKKYKNQVELCYTDTDSLLYFVKTEDFYKDMRDDIAHYDTSNFAADNPFNLPITNAKIPGLFKDEMGGAVVSEFVGLRAKLYCINSNKVQIKKAKGISKAVTKQLNLNNYAETLFDNKQVRSKINMIKSIKHILYSQEVNKLVLNRNDEKRQIHSDQIKTLPWGHCDSVF